MLGICLGFLMITLDATIVNVALKPIVAGIGGSVAAAQWIVDGYTLCFAAVLLLAGTLADRIGARAGYLIGLGVFALGSALCSVSASLGELIGARVLQGAGAAWLMPCSLALITHMFDDVHERRRALAIWAGLSGLGLAAGPILGGVLTAAVGWRAIFLVNLPVAVIACVALLRTVPETRRHRRSLDWIGQPLSIACLAPLTAGFIIAGQRGWTAPPALILIGAGIVAATVFVVSQRRLAHPMIDPALFGRVSFSVSVAIGVIFNFCLYGGLFCLALVLADGHGLAPLPTGLAMLPMTVVVGATAYLSRRLIVRVGEWSAIAGGMSAGAVGALLVALNPTQGSTLWLVAATVPLGLVSMAMAAMTATAMAGAAADQVGLSSGVLNTARQIGGALGVAVLGALLRAGGGLSLHVAFGGMAVAYLCGLGLAVFGLHQSARQPVG